jgi:hypothetical protein
MPVEKLAPICCMGAGLWLLLLGAPVAGCFVTMVGAAWLWRDED